MSLYFLPSMPQTEGAPLPMATVPLPSSWRRPLGVAIAAAVVALLHGGIAVWYLNRPEPVPVTEAMPLPMIDIALSAPPAPSVAQPQVMPPPAPPREVKKNLPKPAKKPKPKPIRKESVAKPVEPQEEKTDAAPPAPPAPPAPVQKQAAAPRGETYTPASADANYLDNPRPNYPGIARQRHWQGLVVLRVFVTPDGRCGDLSVARSSGHEVLDESATDAVRKWKFVPAKRGSTPVASWVTVPIEFNLE